MRTIICSDAHGYPQLITDALAAAGFRPGVDRFVYAGDLVDRGPDPVGCFDLVDTLADVVLFGNHDVACALGLEVTPQDPSAHVLADRLRKRALDSSGKWRFATAADDVLIVHGGVGEHWRDAFEACGRDIPEFANLLDECMREEFAAFVATDEREWGCGALGFGGPLWFRPLEDGLPLVDVRQIVGHTPVELLGTQGELTLAAFDVIVVDPGAYRFKGKADTGGHFRCAVLDDGSITLFTSDVHRPCGGS